MLNRTLNDMLKYLSLSFKVPSIYMNSKLIQYYSYKKGEIYMKVTMQDVANKAGVSKSTVSQFINKRYEYMSEKTKLKIAQSIEELGYIPNSIARSLTQRKTYTIGVIVANIIH